MPNYFRPIPQIGPARPVGALPLAGGQTWFTHVEVLSREQPPRVVDIDAVPSASLARLTDARPSILDMDFSQPQVMGILNTTPDSFSDGGKHFGVEAALAGARSMTGAALIDIGGESTRPGAQLVSEDAETARTAPVIEAIRASGITAPISIDTRKAAVAEAALDGGASLVNDVSGFTFDGALAPLCARRSAPVCVMHAQGDPTTMQKDPQYDDVLLDVFDFLSDRIDWLMAQGVPRDRIIADPGIGFGKTLEHNLALLARLSLYHGLGVPILLGASRKRFIGTIGRTQNAEARIPGSIAVALAALKHGTQIVRVHDVPETLQAIALWRAVVAGNADE